MNNNDTIGGQLFTQKHYYRGMEGRHKPITQMKQKHFEPLLKSHEGWGLVLNSLARSSVIVVLL